MSIINSQPRIGAAGQSTGYKIERSLRFNSADSAYLSRTPSSSSNRKTWTWSAWVKLSKVDGTWQSLFSAYTTSDAVGDRFEFNYENLGSGPVLYAQINQSSVTFFVTNAVYRDPSAWYHIVLAVDTTQSSASNQFKLYINGVQQTFSSNNGVTQNTDLAVNRNIAHAIGRREKSTTEHFSGYMTEVNFIDGSTPTTTTRIVGGVTETILTQFGEFDTDTGVWKPKAYSGSYGTNGFYLKFADNSGTTSTTLGKDSSGNGNNWTPNNFSVTAGTGNDSLVDTPTPYGTDTGAGGEVRGNYCTLSPLPNGPGGTLSNGNLYATSGVNSVIYSTFALTSEKFYWEVTLNGSTTQQIGLADITKTNTTNSAPGDSGRNGYIYLTLGYIYNNGSALSSGLSTSTTNDVICCAYDSANNKLWIRKNNGTWFGGGDPTTGSTPTATTSTSYTYTPVLGAGGGSDAVNAFCNFGQRAFAYTAPSGFKALCTQNLPTPTIGATATTRADDYFNTVLYTGTGSSLSVTGVGFQPDFVWIKERAGAADHGLYDAVRGVQKQLESNNTDAETTETTGLTAFGTDGFTVGALAQLNTNTDTYVAWNWKANGAGAPNTDGSISSTVSVSTLSGFSIVTYTGTGSNATVGHGLGAAPSMMIVKRRDAATSWRVYHISIGNTGAVYLNQTVGTETNSVFWNNTSPTSSVFTVGTDTGVNASSNTFVAYCFAPIAGYSAFGSYTGNGSSDGPFIYTGFRPKYLMWKRTDTTGAWIILDAVRETYNPEGDYLLANAADAEVTADLMDFTSNGFKIRNSTAGINASSGTYVYAAFAEVPLKYSLAR